LGYAGHAADVVAVRWRVSWVTNVYGNRMWYGYTEETRPVAGISTTYDRASYLATIDYTRHTSSALPGGYSVNFVLESRGTNDVPTTYTDWDNWDTYQLDRIEVKYGSTLVRTYDLTYNARSYTDDGKNWQTNTLTSVATSGGGVSAPTISFTYADKNNRANCGAGCQEWAYPRLATVSNGYGAVFTYTYGNDGQLNTSWYNYRVTTLDIADGTNPYPMTTAYDYLTPCYNNPAAGPSGWCNTSNLGELVGYGQTTAITKNFNNTPTTPIAKAVHIFNTADEKLAGRESEIQYQDGSGNTLSKTVMTYTPVTTGFPTGVYFTYTNAVEQWLLQSGVLTKVSKTEYDYNTTTTGNLNWVKEKDGKAGQKEYLLGTDTLGRDVLPLPHRVEHSRGRTVVRNDDRPGMIGVVGTVLGEADINIADMDVGRTPTPGSALMVLATTTPVPWSLIDQLRGTPGIISVHPLSGD
jgi:hypothetical protein